MKALRWVTEVVVVGLAIAVTLAWAEGRFKVGPGVPVGTIGPGKSYYYDGDWHTTPNPRLTILSWQVQHKEKPGDIKLACIFYEADRIVVNPCPEGWAAVHRSPVEPYYLPGKPAWRQDRREP